LFQQAIFDGRGLLGKKALHQAGKQQKLGVKNSLQTGFCPFLATGN
jgi:hypothetical protein